ncbi:NUC173-domain-containing protein [Eremomyces bilateralis CBS 781.70]|uniref:NUC173-domain-containing protein n=1 Tax=Eremomyces bilateralis CBS 781.70 TaxID=1392243 RepID=A0A6G1FTU9_9PEZI|nr:NUC173-domain-containing protein [Eremomyces bilateralis CBS 781.70]KAF1809128.1 NUC173-domain-containing protein [Eremomyces bilateralis CBS 781.70]
MVLAEDLSEKLEKIRSSPKLENQQETAVVLSAVEDTLKEQSTEFNPTAYFAALLSLLAQYIGPEKGIVNKDVATSVVYLLDLFTPYVPHPLLRSKFQQILSNLAPALVHTDAEAPLLRASIGVLESLLVVQDAQGWSQTQEEISPRRAVAGLLRIGMDHRPKVRKRALEALGKVLNSPPPSPSLDHPVAGMCAETALQSLKQIVDAGEQKKKKNKAPKENPHEPNLIHSLHLIKMLATAGTGWPSQKIDSLCEVLLTISRSSSQYLTMSAFEIFEVLFSGMTDQVSSAKLPHLVEVLEELQPAPTDAQLLPPWVAVISRAYEVSSHVYPTETFEKLPTVFEKISKFLLSPSHNIRVSASECLISFLANCIPSSVILEPSIMDEKVLEMVAAIAVDLLSLKYQHAWMEVFHVHAAMFDSLRWRSDPLLLTTVRTVGELRTSGAFNGKKEADVVLAKAIGAMGPEAVLKILPLNLIDAPPNQQGRAWLLPLLRDSVQNTYLRHFRAHLIPISEAIFQKVMDHGEAEKTMQIKILETIVQQIWSILPGYCEFALDIEEAFDQTFAEQLANLLYQQLELRHYVCKALQNLVDCNAEIRDLEGEEDLLAQSRISKAQALMNLDHMAKFSGNLLAVLFNVYSQALPRSRGAILQCINSYLSITPEKDLVDTFDRVVTMLESALAEAANEKSKGPQEQGRPRDKLPPTSHTLLDLLITISVYLPVSSLTGLFATASKLIVNPDSSIQKKAYKLIPRLCEVENGKAMIETRCSELSSVILSASEATQTPARRDRLLAIQALIPYQDRLDLSFIPSVLPEVVLATKEVNEGARQAAFSLLITMGRRMIEGGKIVRSRVPHYLPDTKDEDASIDEYFTMMSAALASDKPHTVAAAVIALSRCLFEFREDLSLSATSDLVQTVELFLEQNSKEIVRAVLGFVKVVIIGLPEDFVRPRLRTLVPGILRWGKEHREQFKARVRSIIERMVRRFGAEEIERCTPEADRKLIANIRKIRDRTKRQKEAQDEGSDGEEHGTSAREGAGRKFASEYDEAVYGSSDESGSEEERQAAHGKSSRDKPTKGTFIMEEDDEPLDLLDRRAMGKISTDRPQNAREMLSKRHKAKFDMDGKLIFRENEDEDMLDDTEGKDPGDGSLEAGINAYVSAIRGQSAGSRGQRGKLKFSSAGRQQKGDDGDDMEVDETELASKIRDERRGRGGARGSRGGHRGGSRGGARGSRDARGGAPGGARGDSRGNSRGGARGDSRGGRGAGMGGRGFGGRGGRGGRGGIQKAKFQRRGLGFDRTQDSRVSK